MGEPLDIVAVNTADRLALANDDTICLITKFLDSNGDETTDTEIARMAIVRYADDKWFPVDLSQFKKAEH